MPKKLFGVEVSKDVWEFEEIDEKALLEKLNANRSGNEPKLSYDEMQQYFLKQKPLEKWSFNEKKLNLQHTKRLDDHEMSRIKADVDKLKSSIRSEKEQQQKENAEKKGNIEKNDERKPEEKIEEKKEQQKTNETGKNEEKSDEKSQEVENQENKETEQKTEEKKIAEKSDKEEEKKDNQKDETLKTETKDTEKKKTEKKETEAKATEKLDVKEALEKTADKFAKNVEGVQAQQAEMAGTKKEISEERMQAFFKDLIDRAMMMQKGLLPKEQIPAYMQDMEALRELNKKQNGGIEEQLMQQRADNLQEIGEEYQKNREVTPKLVKKMDSLDAIDNILTGITRHPKLLFISLLLMGLNPLMAIGMAVMAAFGKSMVQDIYHNLPTAERAQLDQTQPQAQDQQASRDAQTEAYRKGVADAKQQMNEQIEKLRHQDAIDMRSSLLKMKKKYEMALLAIWQREKEQMEKALAEKAAEASQKNADVKKKSAEVEKNPAEKTKEKESEKKETVGKKKDDNGKERPEKKNPMVLEDDEKMLKRTKTKTVSMSM